MLQASTLSLTMSISHLRIWWKTWENIPEADCVTCCVWRGKRGISLPEERPRHSSGIVQQWQERFLGRELRYRGQEWGDSGNLGNTRGGTWAAWKMPRTQIPLFLTSGFSLWRLLSRLPSRGGAAGRGHRAPSGRAAALPARCSAGAAQVCIPKTLRFQLGTDKQKSSCAYVPSEQAKCQGTGGKLTEIQ